MNEKIHYDDFIDQISQESGYDNETVREYLSVMFETIVTESTKGNAVKIRNFGSFQPRWYKARRGINPQTGEPIEILPHYHIHFASSKVLENAINQTETKPFYTKLIIPAIAVLILAILFYFLTFCNEPAEDTVMKQEAVVESTVATQEKVAEPAVEEEYTQDEVVEEPVQEPVIQEEVVEEETAIIEEEPVQKPEPVEVLLYPGSHTVSNSETLSTIGSKIYGSKVYWPLLYTTNSSRVSNPDLILRGYTLDVPDIDRSKKLYKSYMDVHNAYLDIDKMSKSFWILCQGTQALDKDFKQYLKNKLTPIDYAIIEKCSSK